MSRRSARSESILHALGFLAATFALVFGALLPSAVVASAPTGQTIILCSAEGPRTITPGGEGADALEGLKCASCVLAQLTAIPPPPPAQVAPVTARAVQPVVLTGNVALPPPARAPPRPPSTAPPLA